MSNALKKQYKFHYSFGSHNSDNAETRSRIEKTARVLTNNGDVILNDWDLPLREKELASDNSESVQRVRAILNTILEADACIFDFTSQGTEIGFLLSYAITNNKPTLIIVDSENRKDLGTSDFETTFVAGVSSAYITRAVLDNSENIESVISGFIENLDSSHKVKIELSLSGYINDELERRAAKMGISKSELVRKIFAEELQTRGI